MQRGESTKDNSSTRYLAGPEIRAKTTASPHGNRRPEGLRWDAPEAMAVLTPTRGSPMINGPRDTLEWPIR